jgi:hypothetical protein
VRVENLRAAAGHRNSKRRLPGAPFLVLHEEAGVFDDDEAGGAGLFSGSGVGNALLKPEDLGGDGDGRGGNRRNVFGAAEHIDDVDRLGNVLQAAIGFLPEDLGFIGVDREDSVTRGLQIGSDFMGGAAGVRRKTDDGDRLGAAQNLHYRVRRRTGVVRKVKEHHAV